MKAQRESRTKVSQGPIDDKSKGNSRCVTLWTVGHSTRSLDDFIALLQAHAIRRLIDVRTIPRSRHNPQFNQDQLPASLETAGIQYIDMLALGGLRPAHRDSVNAAWRNASFRGFADYMQTPEFDAALRELIRLARGRRTASCVRRPCPGGVTALSSRMRSLFADFMWKTLRAPRAHAHTRLRHGPAWLDSASHIPLHSTMPHQPN